LDNGQHRKSAKPGRRRATKPGDGRLRANKTHLRDTSAGTLRETQEMKSWETERVRHAVKRLQQYAKESAAAARAAQQLPAPPATEEDDDVLAEEDSDPMAFFFVGPLPETETQ